jgi:hypothetical protein
MALESEMGRERLDQPDLGRGKLVVGTHIVLS